MSKIREHIPTPEGDLSGPPEGDLRPYVIFTRLKAGAPHVYAGWLDAADDRMALTFAREHYGQDQACVSIWAIARDDLGMSETPSAATAEPPGATRVYVTFTQDRPGDGHRESGAVEARSAVDALAAARADLAADEPPPPRSIWVAPRERVVATRPEDLIWRHTDQTYRLARGYARDVREKWERIREEPALEEYEKEDLAETF